MSTGKIIYLERSIKHHIFSVRTSLCIDQQHFFLAAISFFAKNAETNEKLP
jgi:hypothetical protein